MEHKTIPTAADLHSIAKSHQVLQMARQRESIIYQCTVAAQNGEFQLEYSEWIDPRTIPWLQERGFEVQYEHKHYVIRW